MKFTKADIYEEQYNPKTKSKERLVRVLKGKKEFFHWIPYTNLPTHIVTSMYQLDGNSIYFVASQQGYNNAFRGLSTSSFLHLNPYWPHYEYPTSWLSWYELPVNEIIKDKKGNISHIRCKKNIITIHPKAYMKACNYNDKLGVIHKTLLEVKQRVSGTTPADQPEPTKLTYITGTIPDNISELSDL